MQPPIDRDDWLGLTEDELPVAAVYDWLVRPHCGAVVVFSGTVRDHADGRSDVMSLTYEAFEDQVVPRLAAIAAEVRSGWPDIGRVALLHRVGDLELGESSVVTAISAGHRSEAFEAARFAIDAIKSSVPIWKHETWADGAGWGTGATPIVDVRASEAAE